MTDITEATEALVQRQLELEQEMAGLGIERYKKLVKKARKKNQESSLDYGQLILRRAAEHLCLDGVDDRRVTRLAGFGDCRGGCLCALEHVSGRRLATNDGVTFFAFGVRDPS